MKTPLSHHIEILMMLIALYLRFQIGKRRFKRRGIAGTQYFRSYGQALLITMAERVINLLAALMMIGALLLWLLR